MAPLGVRHYLLTPFSKEVLIPLSPYPLRHSKSKPMGLGYAFFDTLADANVAVETLHTTEFKSRTLTVRYHVPYVPGEKIGTLRGFSKLGSGSPEIAAQPITGKKDEEDGAANGLSTKILNGLKAKSEAAHAVTSTQNHDLKLDAQETKNTPNASQAQNGLVAANPTVPPGSLRRLSTYNGAKPSRKTKSSTSPESPGEQITSSMLEPEEDAYSNDTIFIRGLKGKATRDAIMEYFKAYNPIKVKITKAKRFAKGWSSRSNVLIKFDFKDGNTIDRVMEECQNCLFDGNPFHVDKAYVRKSALTPSSAISEKSALPKEAQIDSTSPTIADALELGKEEIGKEVKEVKAEPMEKTAVKETAESKPVEAPVEPAKVESTA